MAKKNFNLQEDKKQKLGKLIRELRERRKITLRNLASVVGLSPSNMTYIEKGTNVPTAEIYEKILKYLYPTINEKVRMDKLFCGVRKIPTPEVCQVILNNYELGERIKRLGNTILSPEQLILVEELFKTFGNI